MRKRELIALLALILAAELDLNSYCAGWCRARYQDGFFKDGKCFCGDYYPVNLSGKIDPLHKPRERKFGKVYEGGEKEPAPSKPLFQPDYF